MFGTRRYVGKHRVPDEKQDITTVRKTVMGSKWIRRIGVPVATFMAITLGIGSAAFAAPVRVVSGDTFSELVREHCGTSDWQSVAFPGRDKNLIYAGETIDITCATNTKTETVADTATANNVAPAVAAAPSSGWYNPLPGHTNGSCNYWEWRGSYNHKGEDWPAPAWTPILAAASGQASAHWQSGGAGNYVVIKHGNGAATVYMHMIQQGVSGWVEGGQIIGYVGNTGNSYGNHLHFEVHPWGAWNGVTNPVSWLQERGVSVGC